jgi:hypothetical protein
MFFRPFPMGTGIGTAKIEGKIENFKFWHPHTWQLLAFLQE